MTASATTTTVDLHAFIEEAERDIEAQTEQRDVLGLRAVQGQKGAQEAFDGAAAKLAARENDLTQARGALAALEREEQAAAEAAAAGERASLEAEAGAAEERRLDAVAAVEPSLAALVVDVQAALAASDAAYNANLRLGVHGVSTATRERIEARISHVLRVAADLPAFAVSRSPTGRLPLTGPATPRPVAETRPPLPDRRDIRDEDGVIVSTSLKKDSGAWVEVEPGTVEWPSERSAKAKPKEKA